MEKMNCIKKLSLEFKSLIKLKFQVELINNALYRNFTYMCIRMEVIRFQKM